MWLPWVAAGISTGALVGAVALPFWLVEREHRRAPVPAGWQPGELATITAELRAVHPADPPPAGRHHLLAERAADHISLSRWHIARHRNPVYAGPSWRPIGQPPRWARLAQLRLARRLRATGVPATWTTAPRRRLP